MKTFIIGGYKLNNNKFIEKLCKYTNIIKIETLDNKIAEQIYEYD